MPRGPRLAPGGVVFHVINRGNQRNRIFWRKEDFQEFEYMMSEALAYVDMRLLCYCLMPNHWHMVLWPLGDGDLGRFVHRLSTKHVRRSHLRTDRVGTGHLYQGVYRSFPIQTDDHLFTVLRYVERNPLRAGLVEQAEEWQWSSITGRTNNRSLGRAKPKLFDWPIDKPVTWNAIVNTPLTVAELTEVRVSVNHGRPYGNRGWQQEIAQRLRLERTLRPRGRPTKKRG